MGWRFEEVQIPGLSSTECFEQVIKIVATQRRIGQCIGVGRPVMPATEQDRLRDCATHHYFRGSCVWPPPPGHKRVELVPHICGFGGCTPICDGPGNALMPMLPGREPCT